MCRSIKPLRLPGARASDREIAEAALQYVRKVSGVRAPTGVSQVAFERAVAEVAEATQRLIGALPPRRAAPAQVRQEDHNPCR
jgi:hypothetical protein